MDSNIILEKINRKAYDSQVKYPSGKFSENHIFDEDKSVRWNREEVERQNNNRLAQIKAYRESEAQGEKDFRDDVIQYLLENYRINKNQKIAERIFSKAYDDGHSGGYGEVLTHAEEIADLIEDVLAM